MLLWFTRRAPHLSALSVTPAPLTCSRMSGGSPVKQPRRPSLLPALSGRLSGAGAGAGVTGSGLDPALRAALSAAAHSKTRAPGAPFAAPWSGLAGADRARSDATLQLLRQLSKPTPASATEQSPPRPRADSACVTESTEGDSACSSQGAGVGSVGRAASPFAAAPPAVPPLSAEMLRGLPSPPAASPSVASTAADTAYHSAAGGAPHSRAASSYDGPADTYHWEEGPGPPSGGGADTPRSAVSWYSLRSGMAALPQVRPCRAGCGSGAWGCSGLQGSIVFQLVDAQHRLPFMPHAFIGAALSANPAPPRRAPPADRS